LFRLRQRHRLRGIFGLGVIILLPKLGIVIRFPTAASSHRDRFLSLLALMHLRQATAELRNLATRRQRRRSGRLGAQFICQRPVRFNRSLAFFGIVCLICLGGGDRHPPASISRVASAGASAKLHDYAIR